MKLAVKAWCADSKRNVDECPLPHNHFWAFYFFQGMLQIAVAAACALNQADPDPNVARARCYGYANGFRDGFAEARRSDA